MTPQPWVNEHTPECPVTAGRMKLLDDLDARPGDDYLNGALPEYDNGGDQEVELCTCSRRWSFDTNGMHLMVCIDGGEAATVPLRDGDDRFNAEAERGALDRAYEFKTSSPESVVSIVLAGSWGDQPEVEVTDSEFVAEMLNLLADLDEGENTDTARLRRIAEGLREADYLVVPTTTTTA